MLIPYSGWSEDLACNPIAQPSQIHWNAELRNSTGEYIVNVLIVLYDTLQKSLLRYVSSSRMLICTLLCDRSVTPCMNQLHDDLLRKQVHELPRELCYNYYVVHELLYESVH